MTKKERILRHIQDFGTITPMEAMQDYGSMRLAAIIFDLKKDGYNIMTETLHGTDRYGKPTHWARYRLITNQEPEFSASDYKRMTDGY